MITCADIAAALRAASPGAVIVTGPMICGEPLRLSKMDLGGVTLDATGAVFLEGAAIAGVNGLRIEGGNWGTSIKDTVARYAIQVSGSEDFSLSGALVLAGPGGDRGGVQIRSSRRVTVRKNFLLGHRTAISVYECSDFLVANNWVRESKADGINLVGNQRGIVAANDCEWYVRTGSAHPDGIQLWSLKNRPLQADIWLLNNRLVGNMQGILSSDPKTGSAERLHLHGNQAWVMFSHTITVGEARDCVATHNVLASYPGAYQGANPGRLKGFEHPSNIAADNIMWDGTVVPPPRLWWLGVPDVHGQVGSQFDDRSFNPPAIMQGQPLAALSGQQRLQEGRADG